MGPYFNYQDFNFIENRIFDLTKRVQQFYPIQNYDYKEWILDEVVYINEVDRIEKGLTKLNVFFIENFETKEWIYNDYRLMNFSYENDYKRWLNNLNLIEKELQLLEMSELRYSGDGYSGERISL